MQGVSWIQISSKCEPHSPTLFEGPATYSRNPSSPWAWLGNDTPTSRIMAPYIVAKLGMCLVSFRIYAMIIPKGPASTPSFLLQRTLTFKSMYLVCFLVKPLNQWQLTMKLFLLLDWVMLNYRFHWTHVIHQTNQPARERNGGYWYGKVRNVDVVD